MSDPHLMDAVAALRAGRLVGMPTETVYGLAANACNDEAVAAVFAAKGRPQFNPLIVHVSCTEDALLLGRFSEIARRLARAFWPGPLTLVVPRTQGCPVSWLATAGLESIAIRVPGHPLALDLLRAFGGPLVAPSANRSGHVSPTMAQHVRESLGHAADIVLDGGSCRIGLESTIVACTDERVRLLRPGGLTRDAIEALIGPIESGKSDPSRPEAPGQLKSHYAPRAPVRLNAAEVAPGEALIAFGPHWPHGAALTFNLSEKGDVTEAAAKLFALLRAADQPFISEIAVMPVPETGLGEAINDRLRRAAAARED